MPGTGCNDTLYPGPPSCGCTTPLKSDAPSDSCKNCINSYYPPLQPQPHKQQPPAHTTCYPKKPSQWQNYQAHVLWHAGDPASVAAKSVLQNMFCKQFGVSPCAVNRSSPSTSLHIHEDLGFNIPRGLFSSVVPWLMQRRMGRLGTGFDFDISLNPVTGCEETDKQFSVFGGQRYSFNTNELMTSKQTTTPPTSYTADESSDWAYTCSYDDKELCTTPYANNTTCSDAIHSPGFHLHLFFVNNITNNRHTTCEVTVQRFHHHVLRRYTSRICRIVKNVQFVVVVWSC